MSASIQVPSPQDLLGLMPFAARLGLVVEKAEPGCVSGSLPYLPELCTAAGVLHGGVLMSLADSLAAICAFLNLAPGRSTATTTASTNFLRPVRGGLVTGTAIPVHVGRSAIVVRVDLVDAERRLVATTTQTQAVLPERKDGGANP